VHCDVKPANVQLCDGGRVVLTDFGIAHKMLDGASGITQIFAASPVYTAPELLRGGTPEPASDLFSLGATLFAAVEGKPPFSGTSLFDTCVAVVEGELAPFRRAGALQTRHRRTARQEPCRQAHGGASADGPVGPPGHTSAAG
jgi:serine/threonine protein kinase